MKDGCNWSASDSLSPWRDFGRSFCPTFLAVPAFLGCMLHVAPSYAQRDPTPVTAPITRDAGIPKQTPDTPPQEEELGIRLGSFLLFPTLDLRAGYDSNVFAQPAGQQTGSAYEAIRPSLDVRSDWTNHMLNLSAYGAFGFYNSASSQNYQNFGVNADGRLDIQRDLYLSGSLGFSRTTEALGTPDVAIAQTPTVVNALPANLAFYQRFNRLFYQLSAGITRYTYQDFSAPNAATLPGFNRDRTEFGETLRAGYEVFDGLDFWLQGGVNQRRYVSSVNVSGQQRNSNGWQVQAGSTVDLGGISKLEGYVGYTQQTYFNPSITTGAVAFGLGGVWNGYQPLTVRPFVIRSINETAFSQYQDYVSTTIGSEFNYQILTELTMNVGGSVSLLNYTPVPGTSNTFTHTDTFWRASLGFQYSLYPQLSIGPLYEFAAGSGPDPLTSPNYNRHVIMLRIVAKR